MFDALGFARSWVDAWSRRAVDEILAHYAEHVVFTSPKAEKVVGHARVEGKSALGAYWRTALTKIPTIRFELDHFAWDATERTLAIFYVSEIAGARSRACEVMRFGDGDLIVAGEAFYGAAL